MAAKRNIAAHRLYDPLITRVENGLCTDGDFDMRTSMRDHTNTLSANDVAVFITRWSFRKKLGPRRYIIVTELIDKVLQKVVRD